MPFDDFATFNLRNEDRPRAITPKQEDEDEKKRARLAKLAAWKQQQQQQQTTESSNEAGPSGGNDEAAAAPKQEAWYEGPVHAYSDMTHACCLQDMRHELVLSVVSAL